MGLIVQTCLFVPEPLISTCFTKQTWNVKPWGGSSNRGIVPIGSKT